MRHYLIAVYLLGLINLISCVHSDLNYRFRNFETVYQWSHVNFTWSSYEQYITAVQRRTYIPENIMMGGIKFYGDYMFIALPKHRSGVPVTLTYLYNDAEDTQTNRLLTPYPSWELNDERNCFNLQSMLSMEIDTKGVMWAIDGLRATNNVRCPPKLVLMDLQRQGERIQTYFFPNEICLQNGGYLNDIVIDEANGEYAYITDNSNIDPGLIVYSRYQNRAWKLRDSSMFAEPGTANYVINGYRFTDLSPIDGIALSTLSSNRTVYYTALTGYSLYGIGTETLQDEELCRTGDWRSNVTFIGAKEGHTDGMMVDSQGNLFYTLMSLYGVGKWNTFEPFESSRQVYTDRDNFDWADGLGMDQRGFLYLITTRAYTFLDSNYVLEFNSDIKFRIFKLYTGTRSYLYNDLYYS